MNLQWCVLWMFACALAVPIYRDHEMGEHQHSRKVLGSSVVTSISLVMDDNSEVKTYLADAAGKPIPRPPVTSHVASPINLLNPDRYEFYAFNDSGDLEKRLMTMNEIQGIIAAGDGESAFFTPEITAQETVAQFQNLPGLKIKDVVANVQNVMKGEMEQQKHQPPIQKPVMDTPDVSSTWSMILPAIFGNTGGEIIPDKHSQIVMTPETEVLTQTTGSKDKLSTSPSVQQKDYGVTKSTAIPPHTILEVIDSVDYKTSEVVTSGEIVKDHVLDIQNKTVDSNKSIPITELAPLTPSVQQESIAMEKSASTSLPLKYNEWTTLSNTDNLLTTPVASTETVDLESSTLKSYHTISPSTVFVSTMQEPSSHTAIYYDIEESTYYDEASESELQNEQNKLISTTNFELEEVLSTNSIYETTRQTETAHTTEATYQDLANITASLDKHTTTKEDTSTEAATYSDAKNNSTLLTTVNLETVTVSNAVTSTDFPEFDPNKDKNYLSTDVLLEGQPSEVVSPVTNTYTTLQINEVSDEPLNSSVVIKSVPAILSQKNNTPSIQNKETVTVKPTTTHMNKPNDKIVDASIRNNINIGPTTNIIASVNNLISQNQNNAVYELPEHMNQTLPILNQLIFNSTPIRTDMNEFVNNAATIASLLISDTKTTQPDAQVNSDLSSFDNLEDSVSNVLSQVVETQYKQNHIIVLEESTSEAIAKKDISSSVKESSPISIKAGNITSENVHDLKDEHKDYLPASKTNASNFKTQGPTDAKSTNTVAKESQNNTQERIAESTMLIEKSQIYPGSEALNVTSTQSVLPISAVIESVTTINGVPDMMVNKSYHTVQQTIPSGVNNSLDQHQLIITAFTYVETNQTSAENLLNTLTKNNTQIQPNDNIEIKYTVESIPEVKKTIQNGSNKNTQSMESTIEVPNTELIIQTDHVPPYYSDIEGKTIIPENAGAATATIKHDKILINTESTVTSTDHLDLNSLATENIKTSSMITNPVTSTTNIKHQPMPITISSSTAYYKNSTYTMDTSTKIPTTINTMEFETISTPSSKKMFTNPVTIPMSKFNKTRQIPSTTSKSTDYQQTTTSINENIETQLILTSSTNTTTPKSTTKQPIKFKPPSTSTEIPTFSITTVTEIESTGTSIEFQPITSSKNIETEIKLTSITESTTSKIIKLQPISTSTIKNIRTEPVPTLTSEIIDIQPKLTTTSVYLQPVSTSKNVTVATSTSIIIETQTVTSSVNTTNNYTAVLKTSTEFVPTSTNQNIESTTQMQTVKSEKNRPLSTSESTAFKQITAVTTKYTEIRLIPTSTMQKNGTSFLTLYKLTPQSNLSNVPNDSFILKQTQNTTRGSNDNSLLLSTLSNDPKLQTKKKTDYAQDDDSKNTNKTKEYNITTTVENINSTMKRDEMPTNQSFIMHSNPNSSNKNGTGNTLPENSTLYTIEKTVSSIDTTVTLPTNKTLQQSYTTSKTIVTNSKFTDATESTTKPTVLKLSNSTKQSNSTYDKNIKQTEPLKITMSNNNWENKLESNHTFNELQKEINKTATTIKNGLSYTSDHEKEDNKWKLVSTMLPHHNHDKNENSHVDIKNTPVKPETPSPNITDLAFFTDSGAEIQNLVVVNAANNQSNNLEQTSNFLDENVSLFRDLCNNIGFKLWSAISAHEQSIFRSFVISPFAITSLLSMIFMGARGTTSDEINRILKLDDMISFNPHLVFKNVTDSVSMMKNLGVTTAFVRELYSDRTKGNLLRFYKQRVQQFYSGHVEEVNYNVINDIIKRKTNLLIKKRTGDQIAEYLKTNTISLRPPLSALSANIFQIICSNSSSHELSDTEMPFTVLPSNHQRRYVSIPSVVWRTGLLVGFHPQLNATVVSVGNDNDIVSTVFLLPAKNENDAFNDGLTRLESNFMKAPNELWPQLLRTLFPHPGLEVQIPRFSHRSIVNFTDSMREMGLNDIFDPELADLRGLNGAAKNLYLSDMLQVNTFAVCGENTSTERVYSEVYPDTSGGLQRKNFHKVARIDEPMDYQRALNAQSHDKLFLSLPLPLRPRQARLPGNKNKFTRLQLNRPFLYFARHNPTGFILHIGRFNPQLLGY